MAIGLKSDMKIYDPRMQGGYRERIAQNIEVFNAASRGAIRMTTVSRAGDYNFEAFFKRASGLASRRDLTSTSAATGIKITQGESVSVKLSRKLGPIEMARDAFIKAGLNPGEDGAAFAVGGFAAEAAMSERLSSAIAAGAGALSGQTEIVHAVWDATTPVKLSNEVLVNGTAKRGDRANEIVAWVMHSKPYYDLVGQQVADKVTGIADITMNGGSPASLNKPIIVTDDPGLIVADAVTKYVTLGLVADAITVEDTESEYIINEIVTGGENLFYRMQGEYAYNLSIMGQAWDVANGGANPSAAAIATATNWDKVVDSHKSLGGVYILTN